ncbi:unnamed protein product [Penicillium nalgiovense]|nr:unnamed protein product [Penicillium nalgiovense]
MEPRSPLLRFQEYRSMEPRKLTRAAEDARKEIAEIIPETTTLPNQPLETLAEVIEEDKQNGYKVYGGELLATKIGQLASKMNIGIGAGWRWRLVYWSKRSIILRNEHKRGYLIPLSEDITLNPGGVLGVGFYAYIDNEPTLSQGTAAITIVP